MVLDSKAAALAATDTGELLAALARGIAGADCPPEKIPSESDLSDWIRRGHCPDTAMAESVSRLDAMTPGSWWSGWAAGRLLVAANSVLEVGALVAVADHRGTEVTIPPFFVHTVWRDLPEESRPLHPLGAIVEAWQHRPTRVEPETRKDKRIWPKIEAIPPDAARMRALIFAGNGPVVPGVGQVKLIPDVEPTRAPLLDMVDGAGVPVMARGRGAPLAQRFAVRSLLSVKMQDRGRNLYVEVPFAVWELMAGLFPGGKMQLSRDWPKVREMLRTMHEYVYPLPNGDEWRPWHVPIVPANPRPDDMLCVNIALIRQIAGGPEIDLAELDRLGAQSAPRYRAYLAASSIAWVDGVTRVPVDKSRGQYRYARDVSRYPVITREDRRRLAFGPHDKGNRTKAQIDTPWEDLPGLVVVDRNARDPRQGIEGWRIVPAEVVTDVDPEDTDD